MIVVDASIIVATLRQENRSSEARAFLSTVDDDLLGPALLVLEVRGAMAKQYATGTVTREQLETWPDAVLSLVRIAPLDLELAREALDLSDQSLGMTAGSGDVRPYAASIYDCCYIALARMTGSELATMDMRQAALAIALGIRARIV